MTVADDRLHAQLARFVAVGVVAAIVDYTLLRLGMGAGLDHTPAKALSWVAGTATAYALNRRWTFGSEGSRRKLAAVALLYSLTFAVQVGLFAVAFPPLERAWGLVVAQTAGFVIAQGVATAVNFAVQRAVIFRR